MTPCPLPFLSSERYLTGGWGTAQPPADRSAPCYYDSFFLNAANTSRILKAKANANANVKANGKHAGQAGFIYTVHPWVVQLFFDCNEKHLPGFPHVGILVALRCVACHCAALRVLVLTLARSSIYWFILVLRVLRIGFNSAAHHSTRMGYTARFFWISNSLKSKLIKRGPTFLMGTYAIELMDCSGGTVTLASPHYGTRGNMF